MLGWVGQANAVLQYQTYTPDNDCSGLFGQGFDDCTFNSSPIVIKFGTDGEIEINSIFPSISGSEFSFNPDLDENLSSGTWTYTPNDIDDPVLRYWVAKAADGFNLFWDGTADPASATSQTSNQWWTPDGQGLSHLSFYDTGGRQVPAPSTLMLLGTALVGVAVVRRRRSK
jgi:hypothetical protein